MSNNFIQYLITIRNKSIILFIATYIFINNKESLYHYYMYINLSINLVMSNSELGRNLFGSDLNPDSFTILYSCLSLYLL